jgi:hypothetical protein
MDIGGATVSHFVLVCCLAGVSARLHPLDQEKLPCQDFLSLVCFWHQSVFNSNKVWYKLGATYLITFKEKLEMYIFYV